MSGHIRPLPADDHISVGGHRVMLIDGTPTEGIGRLGPYAVYWHSSQWPECLLVSSVYDTYEAPARGKTWVVRRDPAAGYPGATHWVEARGE
jgi:hypothetical protein